MKYVESPQHLETKCNTYIDYKPGGVNVHIKMSLLMLLILFADRDSLVKSRFLAVFSFLIHLTHIYP